MLDYNLSIDAYHALSPVSKSQLDDLALSPFHFYSRHRNPLRPPRVEKAGQLEGHLAHCAVFEPDQFDARYVWAPKGAPRKPTDAQWNAKKPSPDSVAAMEWWREFLDACGDKRVITVDQYEVAMRQAESVRALPEIQDVLSQGRAEVSAFWTDEMTGVECRCRPDWVHALSRKSVELLDLKTYSCASADEFRRQIARKRYHVQDAFYSAGYSAAAGVTVEKFTFVAVETEWPYAAASYTLGPESREEGFLECRRLLDLYEECVRLKRWPGYSNKTTQIDLPPYAFTSQEIEIAYV